MYTNYTNDKEAADALAQKFKLLKSEIGKIIVGQEEVVDQVLISIFSRGHCLLVGLPGLAKTLLINTISKTLGLTYNRIQFTPDLMPSDIIGTEILDESRQFRFIKGPLFANIILADEINRTPPKTQSALLEAMQEYAVTTSGKRYDLGQPFFVLATQNPIEQEGTYPLPEAQLDRFMFNVLLSYPSVADEILIVKNTTSDRAVAINTVVSADEILYFQQLVRKVPVNDTLLAYVVNLVAKTRPNTVHASKQANDYLAWGAGPRASQNLIIAAKCHALLHGSYSPDIENVKAVAHSILRHRIVRSYKAEAEGISVEKLIDQLL
ncbi:MAG: hypothetical protein RIQ89_971 [Bacteroidota bacterium]|jgi:MoxR-like ATPase